MTSLVFKTQLPLWVPWASDVWGSGSGRRRGGQQLAVSAEMRGWRDGLGPKRDGYLPGLCCIRGQVDLWQTHTILICAQPDNASQGQNSSAQCFLTGCFFNYMSEAIKLRRRFSHKALFYVSVITVNYKQQEKRLKGKRKMQKEKWVYSFSYTLFVTLLVHWSFVSLIDGDTVVVSIPRANFRALIREEIVHLSKRVWKHEASIQHTKGKKNKSVQILNKWIIQES